MSVKKSVFGSKEERKFFQKLEKTWGDSYHIYHNLPFLNLINGRGEFLGPDYTTFKLTDEQYEHLKKTSVDYVICNKADEPILAIEFDGLYQGVNLGANYQVGSGKKNNELRKSKLELKLRVAHGCGFPFIVLGSKYFKGLSGSIYLTIVDAIIGDVISQKKTQGRVAEGFNPVECGFSVDEFDTLSEHEKREIIQAWFDNISIESDFETNPIVRKVGQLMRETKSGGFSYYYGNDPSINKEIVDCVKCTVENHLYGSATAEVSLPRFSSPGLYFSTHLAHEIAQLIALSEIQERMKVR
ncbi:DUF2726 domain-containing protein [Coraliomargarita algicola]|uniref:DUF2726 domain-containing protein n=1 Tax=Coraliomargarita algicola TaxID=3092156 RepID=A0ABZ0RK26_9BACT|nr:DUF2726 domain-containing protein [Coraliomargarita sp. J2-16]WPJ96555.1 DUF2726 domain-containing protein [Coraliomargarita sp. J2-16]